MTVRERKRSIRYSEAEWKMRVELAAGYRVADMFGFSDIIWNHITAKVPDSERFLLNRFGLRFDEVTASNLITMDADGKVVDRGSASSDEDVNGTAFHIHSGIHAARPDVQCIMHSHSPAGMAVSVLKNGLTPMIHDVMPFHDRVAYHDYEGLSIGDGERIRMASNLGDKKAMILRNHGLLTCGETVGEAFMLMYYLERACKVQLQVLASGQEFELPSPELREATAIKLLQFPYGKYEWPALVRLVEKNSPEYSS